MLIKIISIFIAVGLIFFGIQLIGIIEKEWKTYWKIKKEWCIAPKTTKNGHTGPTKADIFPLLKSGRKILSGYILIFSIGICAFVDCVMRIIGR